MSAAGPPVYAPADRAPNVLTLRRLGIDTYQEGVLYMSVECPLCRFSIVATLNVVTGDLLAPHEASLSEAAWRALGATEYQDVALAHPPPLDSLRHVRAKLYGARVDEAGFTAIMRDIATGRYAAIEIAAFVAACAGGRLTAQETTALTRAMIAVGDRLTWPQTPVADKHSVGGLPGNRTTMLVVPIVAAYGLTMPKTSSRAITSPAGTADAMETVAPVALDLEAMRRVVEAENGCIVWGGNVGLSPADDLIIRVERPLDIDSDAQLVASVLSKKAAAGATHVVIDMPVGPTTKVRSTDAAQSLASLLSAVGDALGLSLRVIESDGSQPVGRGIGPALEARDVLAIFHGERGAPADLRAKAVALAGEVLELAGGLAPGTGAGAATAILDDGRAWRKFVAICEAQGGLRQPPVARLSHDIPAIRAGQVVAIDNRRLARVAKLAGAPKAPAAGLVLHAPVGGVVSREDPLFALHAETPGELAYARAYADANPDIVALAETP